MAKKTEGRFKKDRFGLPDPLHFDMAHHHKKLLELLYIVAIVGAILSVAILNSLGVLSVEEANASAMVLLFLIILLAMIIIEKSLVSHRHLAHKPVKG